MFSNRYFLVGTWNSWAFQEMSNRSGCHEAVFRIGPTNSEEFLLLRDRDWNQVIYPAARRATSSSAPLRGPDACSRRCTWLVQGREGSVVCARLCFSDTETKVVVTSASGSQMWRTPRVEMGGRTLHIVGCWNRYSPEVVQANDGLVFRHRLLLNPSGLARFHFLITGDKRYSLHPAVHDASLGESELCGPDFNDDNINWQIQGEPFEAFEILVDFTQKDDFRTVTWSSQGSSRDLVRPF